MKTINNAILKNWSVRGYDNTPYTAPEALRFCLHGEVYGHPNFEDGNIITTSVIKASNYNFVETQHTVYELGEADVSYLLWCEENGIKVDKENPVKIRKLK